MRIRATILSRACFLLFIGLVSQTAAQETKLKWFGHAAFSITTTKGKVLLIDPWLRNTANPEVKDGKDPLAAISRVDYGLLQNADGFAAEIKKLKIGYYEMKPGDSISFRGRQLIRSG
jgi:hypothetical protein